MSKKETAALSVGADRRPCVPLDTKENQVDNSLSQQTHKSKHKFKGFFLPNHIFDFELAPGAFCVYCYLCRCRNVKDGNVCFPSYRTIAQACCISKRTVSNALRQLESLGLVLRQKRFHDRRQTSNLYFVPEPGANPACSPVPYLLGDTVQDACQEQDEGNSTNK